MKRQIEIDAEEIANLIRSDNLEEAESLWKEKTANLKYWECSALRDLVRTLSDQES